MIVLYDKANICSLPYNDKSGKLNYFSFIPGKNEIKSEVWDAICKHMGEDRMGFYEVYLKVFKSGKDDFQFSRLSTTEAKELVDNTMEIKELDEYLKLEEKKKKPRKAVIGFINSKKKEIQDFMDKVAESKKKDKK